MGSKDFLALLVEADPRDVALLNRAFSDIGLPEALRTVTSLDGAIDYLSGKGKFGDRKLYPIPSLILVSLALSRTSDFKMLRWKNSQSHLRRIPVVVLASSREPPGFDKAFDLGAVSYLVKPIDREALGSMVKAVVQFWELDQRQDRRRASSEPTSHTG